MCVVVRGRLESIAHYDAASATTSYVTTAGAADCFDR